jgi:hypothetical protein
MVWDFLKEYEVIIKLLIPINFIITNTETLLSLENRDQWLSVCIVILSIFLLSLSLALRTVLQQAL